VPVELTSSTVTRWPSKISSRTHDAVTSRSTPTSTGAVGGGAPSCPSSHTNPISRPRRRQTDPRLPSGAPSGCLKGVDQCWSQKQRLHQSRRDRGGEQQDYEHARSTYRRLLNECEKPTNCAANRSERPQLDESEGIKRESDSNKHAGMLYQIGRRLGGGCLRPSFPAATRLNLCQGVPGHSPQRARGVQGRTQ